MHRREIDTLTVAAAKNVDMRMVMAAKNADEHAVIATKLCPTETRMDGETERFFLAVLKEGHPRRTHTLGCRVEGRLAQNVSPTSARGQ